MDHLPRVPGGKMVTWEQSKSPAGTISRSRVQVHSDRQGAGTAYWEFNIYTSLKQWNLKGKYGIIRLGPFWKSRSWITQRKSIPIQDGLSFKNSLMGWDPMLTDKRFQSKLWVSLPCRNFEGGGWGLVRGLLHSSPTSRRRLGYWWISLESCWCAKTHSTQ